uniref:metal-dependent hydrolase n=1 Tax=Nonomuraea sp. CA-251285 TaxID=3240002 RepID=UPI003F499D6D
MMATGSTHALSGVTFYAGAAVWLAKSGSADIGVLQALTLAPIAAGAAMLPDLDHPDATMARSLGWPSRQLARLVSFAGGGHRGLTHSLAGAALFGLAAHTALTWRDTIPGMVGLAVLLALLISSAVRVCRIPGWIDDAIGIALGPALVWLRVPLDGLPLVVAGGCLVHMLGDLPTDRGLPVFWPLPGRVRLPRALTFKVGGTTEVKVIRRGLGVALVGVLGWAVNAHVVLAAVGMFFWDTFASFTLTPS